MGPYWKSRFKHFDSEVKRAQKQMILTRRRYPPLAVLGLFVVGLAGCAIAVPALPQDSVFRKHVILAHEDGWPIIIPEGEKGTKSFSRDESEQYNDLLKEKILGGIDAYARKLWAPQESVPAEQRAPLKLLLFVHGGLNGYNEDFKRMKEMMPEETCQDLKVTDRKYSLFVSAACTKAKSAFYPVFINWNSGLLDSIGDDLIFVRFGHRLKGWETLAGVVSMPFVLASRLAASVFLVPNSWGVSVWRQFEEGEPAPVDIAQSVLMSPVRALTTPGLKAFGTSAWEIMKSRADLLTAAHLPKSKTGVGAGLGLIRALNARIGRLDNGAGWKMNGEEGPHGPVEITLVGHSMGAIVLNRLIAAESVLSARHIVYLAPASSNYEVGLLLEPYLKRRAPKSKTDFWLFTLHNHDEQMETQWKSFIFPRGSLLVWIDNYFEPGTSAGDERSGRYRASQKYFDGKGRLTNFHLCPWPDSDKARPRKHGDMDVPATLERVLWKVDPEAFASWKTDLEALGRSVEIAEIGNCDEDEHPKPASCGHLKTGQ